MPPAFPPLPEGNWPLLIVQAHAKLNDGYTAICSALAQEDTDPARMRLLRQRIDAVQLPLLQALETDKQLPQQWITDAASLIVNLIPELDSACKASETSEDKRIFNISTVYTVHNGRRGRPQKRVPDVVMLDWFGPERQLSARSLAKSVGVDRRTIRREMDRLGIEREFHDITSKELDELYLAVKRERPEEGISYFTSVLRDAGLRIQQHRITDCLKRCNQLELALSAPVAAPRVYQVARPDKVWHCDGHHKLIRWGFVIHGFVDGFSRMITGMAVNTNNRAETVLELFLDAKDKHTGGVGPSRLRGDRGGENIRVAVWMILNKGANRGSFLWGSSTRNTRIERLWLEVGVKFVRRWRAFFTRLERLHHLDPANENHLWLLHYVFLDELRADCAQFVQLYNLHPSRDKRARNDPHPHNTGSKSPSDLYLRGKVQEGIYLEDELVGVDPALLRRYYSVDRPYTYQTPAGSGAGHSDDDSSDGGSNAEPVNPDDIDDEAMNDDDYDMDDLEEAVAYDQTDNIRHEAIEPPASACPFNSAAELALFREAFALHVGSQTVPEHYGLLEAEMEHGFYPLYETIDVARKPQQMELNLDTWYPRAVRWAQALELMTEMLEPQ